MRYPDVRKPWWKRLPGGPPPIELAPDTFGGRVEAGQRKTIHVKPPAEPNPDAQPELNDAERANMWKGIADRRLDKIRDLQDENDRLRADLALARDLAAVRPADCGHEATLRRYDEREARCRAEHVDRDELERRVGAAARAERWPF